jgi:hypothetical protein
VGEGGAEEGLDFGLFEVGGAVDWEVADLRGGALEKFGGVGKEFALAKVEADAFGTGAEGEDALVALRCG